MGEGGGGGGGEEIWFILFPLPPSLYPRIVKSYLPSPLGGEGQGEG